MNKLIAIGDIHGEFDLLMGLMKKLENHRENDENFTIVFLGDYVDRGLKSKEVLDFLMAGPQNKDTWICLKGNHEDLMVEAYANRDHRSVQNWTMNGGFNTVRSYDRSFDASLPDSRFDFGLMTEHAKWLDNLPLYAEFPNHICVHAGLMPGYVLEEQEDDWLIWIRDRFLNCGGDPLWNKHIIHGHTPESGSREWRTNLDSGSFYSGIQTAGIFDMAINSGPIELVSFHEGEDL